LNKQSISIAIFNSAHFRHSNPIFQLATRRLASSVATSSGTPDPRFSSASSGKSEIALPSSQLAFLLHTTVLIAAQRSRFCLYAVQKCYLHSTNDKSTQSHITDRNEMA
jgi:hypothetical protein